MTRCFSIVAAITLGCAGAAIAQPADDTAINAFVESHTARTHLGRIARWDDPVCPGIAGLPANFGKFILERIRTVAAAAGAKVDPEGCRANISIVFTTSPQALIDGLRAKDPVMLGYFDNSDQADKLAKVNHPIQAWYVTKTVDLRGKWTIDANSRYLHSSANYETSASNGTRVGDGLNSAFFSITVVADPSKLGAFEIGALADNVAMLALSQPSTLDECTALPSIENLALTGCTAAAKLPAMSANDSGFLYGLYHVKPGASLGGAKDSIAFGMKEKLAGR
ncbi:MAG: hypothetical protein H0U98_12370 [Alphaproteobacteria bacterium]|nr:hypothetical protein [Alphaproteobacteria bacterium]